MSKLIEVLIEVVFFSSLIGTIAGLITDAVTNLTGATAIVVGLTTLFVALGFVVGIMKKTGIKGK